MFFFLTLYMQNVLGYSAIQTGAAYLPLCFAVVISSGVSSQLLTRDRHPTGDRRRRPDRGRRASTSSRGSPSTAPTSATCCRACLIVALGLGGVFVGVTTAANAGVPADKAGLAAALLNSSQQLGGALGLAIFSAIATSRTNDLLASRTPRQPEALTSGFQRALLAASLFLLAAAIVALRATNTRGEEPEQTMAAGASPAGEPELAAAPGRAGA